jgi:hypothetical protein
MKTILFSIFILLCPHLAECAKNNQWFIDEGPVQIGCRFTVAIPHEADEASPRLQGNQVERMANLRFGFPWWLNHDSNDKNTQTTINGMIVSPLIDVAPGTLNGVAVSCIFVHDKVNGVVIAPLFNITKETNGLALSCWNWSSDKAVIQAGLINFCEFLTAPGEVDWQIGILNEAGLPLFQFGLINNSWVEAWLQLGLTNTVIKPDKFALHGEGKWPSVQIGLYNDARKGIQIGLLNRNESGWLWKYSPLINFSENEK